MQNLLSERELPLLFAKPVWLLLTPKRNIVDPDVPVVSNLESKFQHDDVLQIERVLMNAETPLLQVFERQYLVFPVVSVAHRESELIALNGIRGCR